MTTRLIQQGPRDARVVIVGEAPGKTEDATGVPFAGGSGDVLNRMLSQVGISRSQCFITNVCHTRPPENDFEWFLKPKPRLELLQGLLQLKNDLTTIQPNIVVALGSQPLRFLTGKIGIDKWRGSVLPCTLVPGLKVIGTYHPAYVLRIWDYKAICEFDLKRVAREATTKVISRPQRELILNPSRERSVELVRELLNADWLGVDIECFEVPGGWRLACVGFSDRRDRAVVWPCDEPWQLDIIRLLVQSPVRKVFQNGMFDVTVLLDNGMVTQGYEWDTMCGMHSLFPECAGGEDEMSALTGKKKQSALKKGLAFQTSIFTDEPYYKDDGKLWKQDGNLMLFWEYNAKDAAVTREIRDVQEQELRDFGTTETFQREMAAVEPLLTAMRRGIRTDPKVWADLRTQLEREIANLQSFLDASAGGSVNVKSPKQMLDLLYNKLNLPIKRHRQTKNPTTNKDAIVELAGKYEHPVLQTILEIRQRRDYIERYLNATVDADGRMRCSFDVTGTRSGRLSSRQSIYGSGTNLQNIPTRKAEGEAIKRGFLPDVGKVFVYRDFSQAEARIVAQLANANRLIELFNDPSRDVHTENAARIFGKPVEQITETERYLAKRVVHACNYGMEADRLVQVVNEDYKTTGIRITLAQARDLIAKYFMLYPQIKSIFWKTVENEIRYSRTLNTPFGRKRQFFGRWDDKLLREAYSYIPQSTVGDLGIIAVTRCYHEIERVVDGAELLLNVHDSVMMQCWERDVELVASEMERVMNIPITINGRTFTIPSDCKVGYNWGVRPKKNPEQNPQGLVDLAKWLKERQDATKAS